MSSTLGWIRPARKLNVTFAPGMPVAGPIAFISHSGALAVTILDWSRDRRMGFSLVASLGNQAVTAGSGGRSQNSSGNIGAISAAYCEICSGLYAGGDT